MRMNMLVDRGIRLNPIVHTYTKRNKGDSRSLASLAKLAMMKPLRYIFGGPSSAKKHNFSYQPYRKGVK